MNTSIYLDVKAFIGCDIAQIASDICALANRVGVTVCADVNDSFLMAHPGETPQKVIENYTLAVGRMNRRVEK